MFACLAKMSSAGMCVNFIQEHLNNWIIEMRDEGDGYREAMMGINGNKFNSIKTKSIKINVKLCYYYYYFHFITL